MGYQPFWQPAAYIPVLGMLCGNAISAIVVAITSILRDVKCVSILICQASCSFSHRDNRDKVEMYLVFGGSVSRHPFGREHFI